MPSHAYPGQQGPPFGREIAAQGVLNGIQWITVEGPAHWGTINGYVKIPEGHPLQADREAVESLSVHGGITYAGDSWIGFDTGHAGDVWPDMPEVIRNLAYAFPLGEPIHWTPEMVVKEVQWLATQVAYLVRPVSLDLRRPPQRRDQPD